MQRYDIAMKIALSSDFHLLPLPGAASGGYREFEIKRIGATLRPDGVVETPGRIYVLEYSKVARRDEALEAAVKAHLVAMERKADVWAVLVVLEGSLGERINDYHMVYHTRTRCDVDVIVINERFIGEIGRRYGVSIDEMRDEAFWERDSRALGVIAGAGRIICLWVGEGCRIAMARRAKREGLGIEKDLYLITDFLT